MKSKCIPVPMSVYSTTVYITIVGLKVVQVIYLNLWSCCLGDFKSFSVKIPAPESRKYMLKISILHKLLLKSKYLVHMWTERTQIMGSLLLRTTEEQQCVCVCQLFTRYTHMLGKLFGWSFYQRFSRQCSCIAVSRLAILMLSFML